MFYQRKLVIRKASAGDLSALAAGDPGHIGILEERLDRQKLGKGRLLVATIGGRLVGHVYVWWERADEPALRIKRPGVPLIMNLWVHRVWRGRGIGTALTRCAEVVLIRRGHHRLALGIDPGNVRASRLYLGLDYVPWEHGDLKTHYDDFLEDGTRDVRWEICAVLEKDLAPVAPSDVRVSLRRRHRTEAVRAARRAASRGQANDTSSTTMTSPTGSVPPLANE